MQASKLSTVVINLLGGAAVLGSYVWGFRTLPDASTVLWGGVPPIVRPVYTVCMFLAAAGYFLFTYFILFDLPASETRIAGGWGYGLLNFIYAAILVPSALWMPLTSAALDSFSPTGRRILLADLLIVALASLGLLFALVSAQPRSHLTARRWAIIGCVVFCLQTVVLDAMVWSALF